MKLSIIRVLFLIMPLLNISCEKEPTPEAAPLTQPSPTPTAPTPQMPPQPVVDDTVYVSAVFPGFQLSSVHYEHQQIDVSSYFLTNGTIEWKCLSRPDLAAAPIIESPGKASTVVSQLSKGAYVFEVAYRTSLGNKTARTNVYVIDDGLAQGPVVLPSQTWKLEDWTTTPGYPYWISLLLIENRPDLFCNRKDKKIKIEIQDALNGTWIEALESATKDPVFNISQSKQLAIHYDHQDGKDSALDRIVTQKTAIRVSLQ